FEGGRPSVGVGNLLAWPHALGVCSGTAWQGGGGGRPRGQAGGRARRRQGGGRDRLGRGAGLALDPGPAGTSRLAAFPGRLVALERCLLPGGAGAGPGSGVRLGLVAGADGSLPGGRAEGGLVDLPPFGPGRLAYDRPP